MTLDEMKAFLRHPAISVSWFGRQMYPGQKGAERRLHQKLRGEAGQRFLFDDKVRLRKAITEFSNYDLNERND